MRKREMSGKILGIALVLLMVGLMFAGVVPSAGAPGDDYHVYSKFNAPGTGLVWAAGGYVEYYGVPEWGDEIQYVYFLQREGSRTIAYKVKVWVTNEGSAADPTPYIDIRQHPDHPTHIGPIEPRHFEIVSSFNITEYADTGGWASDEFHVDSTGVYLGAWPHGINKWDLDWNYIGQIANPPPSQYETQSLAYDPAGNVWYAGNYDRKILQLSDTDGDGNFMDETWQYIFTTPDYAGSHHDGMEYVGGYLWISDMTSDVIAKWQYDDSTDTWAEIGRYHYTEAAVVEGMGFGPNDHFWIGGYGYAYIYELGNEITKGYPLAEAGPDVEAHPPTIPVKLDASGSHHTDPAKEIVLYEWDFESDGTWDYSFGRFVYPTGLLPTAPDGKRSYGYDGACTYYKYAGWLARGNENDNGDYLKGLYHIGQDIEANEGDSVYAIADGVVTYISSSGWGTGNIGVVVKHKLHDGAEFLALYGHVHSSVSINDHVEGGKSFATIGPFDSIPHLHFGIHPGLTMPQTNWGRMPLSSWSDPNAYSGDPNGPDINGFVDPIEWITTRTPLKPVPLYVEHTYPAYYNPDGSIDWDKSAKDYTATLRVTDNSNPPLQDMDTCIVHITAPPWKPVADPNGPYEGRVGTPIQLDGSKSYDPESKMFPPDHPWYETIAKYEWDLDYDGEFDDSTDVKPSWTWDSQGIYIVGLKITDSQASGPGGTIGPLDVDIKYATVLVKKPEAILFAPNMWFDSTEQYFATTPFFYTDDIYETSGEKSKTEYLDLSEDQKWDNFAIFYHIAETEDEIVYEYWFYYPFNDFINKHYHDWETVFVFVDKDTEQVTRVVASAHESGCPNNEFVNPEFVENEHVGILIEEGSHASCTDRNNNGLFERDTDVTNGYVTIDMPVIIYFPYLHIEWVQIEKEYAWGIGLWPYWVWDDEDQLNGDKINCNDQHYNLKEITDEFISKFGGLNTFPNSPAYYSIPVNVPIIGGTYTMELFGYPPEHPWVDTDGRYYYPNKIIPILSDFVTGTVSGSDARGAIVVIISNDTYHTFAGENGTFLINNVSSGIHDIVVNLDGHPPYKQRFVHSSNTTVGVDGILHLIPESEAFRIEGIVTDEKGGIIVNAVINVYGENGVRLFTTLTDENGQYLVIVSEEHIYTVTASTETEEGSVKVSGEAGSVVGGDIRTTKKTGPIPVPILSPFGMVVLITMMLIVLINEAVKKRK